MIGLQHSFVSVMVKKYLRLSGSTVFASAAFVGPASLRHALIASTFWVATQRVDVCVSFSNVLLPAKISGGVFVSSVSRRWFAFVALAQFLVHSCSIG